MIVCPVCEHPQSSGAECEVCGKRLAAPGAALPTVAPVEGLEPTRHPGAAPIAGELFAGLEPTGHAAVEVAPELPVPIEATAMPPVDVLAEEIPDLERTEAALPDPPTPLPALVTCRYCRTPAMPGERICSRCGMRLPVVAGVTRDPVVAPRRCGCGAAVRGPRCASCGARAEYAV
jgi:hypothetical protein